MKWKRCGRDVVGKDSAGCGSGIHSAKTHTRGSAQADPDNRAGKPEYGLTPARRSGRPTGHKCLPCNDLGEKNSLKF